MAQNYHHVTYGEPHLDRTRRILETHPEVRSLFGYTPISFVYLCGVVALQIALAGLVSGEAFWVQLLCAFFIGAFANHSMFVMIHEATHNLIFKSTIANYWAGMIANLPIVFPSAIGFRRFHLLHHRYQGEMDKDADLAGPKEAAWVGNSTVRKAIWFLFFWVVEGIVRPSRLKNVKFTDRWLILNVVVELTFLALMFAFFGWGALIYLGLSTVFSVGLHPVGARWIQEHYIFKNGQETYSYYGPGNKLSFNVGFHNEHHDLINVPWSRLPKLKAMAPEFYESLYFHTSYTRLFFRFLFDKNLTLFDRVVRPEGTNNKAIIAAQKAKSKAPVIRDEVKLENQSVPDPLGFGTDRLVTS